VTGLLVYENAGAGSYSMSPVGNRITLYGEHMSSLFVFSRAFSGHWVCAVAYSREVYTLCPDI
jgi:hypothetical protein